MSIQTIENEKAEQQITGFLHAENGDTLETLLSGMGFDADDLWYIKKQEIYPQHVLDRLDKYLNAESEKEEKIDFQKFLDEVESPVIIFNYDNKAIWGYECVENAQSDLQMLCDGGIKHSIDTSPDRFTFVGFEHYEFTKQD